MHRSQEHVELLKEIATLTAPRTTRGRPGRASVAVQQCMTQFGLYGDFKMIPQQVNRVANLPEWTTVLEVMIESRREDLAFRSKNGGTNECRIDRRTRISRESIKALANFRVSMHQPKQTELIWTMPWGYWVEREDKNVHCKEWECIIDNFTEEESNATVHRIYGQRATLSVNFFSKKLVV